MNNKVHVKTGDTVVILNGKDRGKRVKYWLSARKRARSSWKAATWSASMLSPENGRAGRHCKGGRRYVRMQGSNCLPPLRQTHPCCP